MQVKLYYKFISEKVKLYQHYNRSSVYGHKMSSQHNRNSNKMMQIQKQRYQFYGHASSDP